MLFLPRYAILSVMGGEFSSPFPVYKRFILPNGYRKVKAFFVNICVLEQDAISRIESGSRMVQDYELRALAEVLGVTSDWLMDEEEK